MTWTKLDYKPPAPESLGKAGNTPDGLDALGKLMKFAAAIMGAKGTPDPGVRGFFGMDVEDKDNKVVVRLVLAKCPASAAGLQVGDVVLSVEKREVTTRAELVRLLTPVTPGQMIRFRCVLQPEDKSQSQSRHYGFMHR